MANKRPQCSGTRVTKPIKVCLKCNLQPGTWHFPEDFQICAISSCPLQFSRVIFIKESENPILESIYIIRNGKANFITFPVKIVFVINFLSHSSQFYGMLLTTYFSSHIHQHITEETKMPCRPLITSFLLKDLIELGLICTSVEDVQGNSQSTQEMLL